MEERVRAKRILKDFIIDEISAVDVPSQQHARAVIMKRNTTQERDNMRFRKIIRDEPLAFDSFEAAVSHLQKMHDCPKHVAMSKARTAHPILFEKYQREGEEIAKRARAKAARPQLPERIQKAVTTFKQRAREIAKRDNIPEHIAMTKARREFPDEFDAAYGREV